MRRTRFTPREREERHDEEPFEKVDQDPRNQRPFRRRVRIYQLLGILGFRYVALVHSVGPVRGSGLLFGHDHPVRRHRKKKPPGEIPADRGKSGFPFPHIASLGHFDTSGNAVI